MKFTELVLANRIVKTDKAAFVMGIVNATPDSFFENSRGGIERALRLIDEGADVLDIGGESTRPGSDYVEADEEIKRIVPVVEEIRRHSDIPISIDTRKYEVFKAAFESGADILNDVSALEDDERMAPYAAIINIPVILMHKRGNPVIMQKNTEYKDVISEVDEYLTKRALFAESCGISSNKIILDPGVGFGKDLSANLALIKNGGNLSDSKYPVLMALSRKTCIGQVLNKDVDDRLFGTLAADIVSVLAGAFMIRVHDVSAAVDTMKMLKALGNI